MSTNLNELYQKVLDLRDLLIARATGEYADEEEYIAVRRELLADPLVNSKLPAFIKRHRELGEFWSFIKGEAAQYEPRRVFLREQFYPALDHLENLAGGPADSDIEAAFDAGDLDAVRAAWKKAAIRRVDDPEGAITAARTLLETVCKHILDERGVAYEADADLPKLYSLVAKELSLAPSGHTEKIFKQILGGAQSVVEGLGALRNRLGDSHGVGKVAARPRPRHAQLAVNLAGSMAAFLIETSAEKPSGPMLVPPGTSGSRPP